MTHMRTRLGAWILLALSTAGFSRGQSLAFAPIPGDPHELVTPGQFPAHAADLTPVLELLTRARGAMNLHAADAPPYQLTAEFTSNRAAADSSKPGCPNTVGDGPQVWVTSLSRV